MTEASTRPSPLDVVADRRFHDIGWAVKQLHDGQRVRRRGWNGRGMWLGLELPYVNTGSKMTLPFVYMFTADGKLVPWLCSQTDLLAIDWELAE